MFGVAGVQLCQLRYSLLYIEFCVCYQEHVFWVVSLNTLFIMVFGKNLDCKVISFFLVIHIFKNIFHQMICHMIFCILTYIHTNKLAVLN